MGNLVTDDEMVVHLDITGDSKQKEVLNAWIAGLEAALAAMTNQVFTSSTTVITNEEHVGTDRDYLWLNRAASAIGNVIYGQDPSNPTGTLDGTDPLVLYIDAKHPRKIHRAYGALFRKEVRWFVSYTPVANQPAAAAIAVREAVAFLWRRMGSEDAASERKGEFSHQMLRDLNDVPAWRSYLEHKGAPSLA